MNLPVSIPDLTAYLGHTLHVGALTFTAVSGSFIGSRVVVRVGRPEATVVQLESDDDDSQLTWSGGVLSAWELTPAQVALIAAADAQSMWITIEEASPSNNVELAAVCNRIEVKPTAPDLT